MQYLTLTAALRARGISVSPPTVWRWYTRGTHGVRLKTYMVGGRRMTTLADLDAFIAATTAASNIAPPADEPAGRMAETAARLAAAGVI